MIKQIHRVCKWYDLYFIGIEDKKTYLDTAYKELTAKLPELSESKSLEQLFLSIGDLAVIVIGLGYYSDRPITDGNVGDLLELLQSMGFAKPFDTLWNLVDAVMDSRYTKTLDQDYNIVEGESFKPVSLSILEDAVKNLLASKLDLGK